jgi:hypothetical protein
MENTVFPLGVGNGFVHERQINTQFRIVTMLLHTAAQFVMYMVTYWMRSEFRVANLGSHVGHYGHYSHVT